MQRNHTLCLQSHVRAYHILKYAYCIADVKENKIFIRIYKGDKVLELFVLFNPLLST